MSRLDHRKTVQNRFCELKPEIEQACRELWNHPELPLLEYSSAAYASKWLEDHGFSIGTRAGRIPTAFTATLDRGEGPVIGVLAEYDALPGVGNEAVPYHAPTENPIGHACGHNLIGASNIGAAITAGHALQDIGLPGKIVVFGTPAEEIVYGKVAMLGEGLFDGIDVLLTSHGDYQNGVINRPCLALCHGEFQFSGISSHSGAVRRHNALEAVELAVQSFERLRAHNFNDAIVEHVIRNGGIMPGITPDKASLWIYVRHPSIERAVEVYNYITAVIKSAESLTNISIREHFISATSGYLPNTTIAETLFNNMEIVGPPKWNEEDTQWMRELVRACGKRDSFSIDTDIALHTEGVDPFGQDDGEASWRIPLGRVNWAQPAEVPLHNWATSALSGSEAGCKGALMASETIALTILDLVAEPEIVWKAQRELSERTEGKKIIPPMYGPVDEFAIHAETFWRSYGLSLHR